MPSLNKNVVLVSFNEELKVDLGGGGAAVTARYPLMRN